MQIATNTSQSKKLWYLKNINVFSGLSWQELRELKRVTRMVDYRKNEPIYLPGEPSEQVYMLKKGRVKLSKMSHEGRQVTIAILVPGEIFGEVEVLNATPRESIVEALEPVMVCEIQRSDFDRYLKTYPEVGGKVIKFMSGRLRQLETRVGDLVFKSAPARLASLLLELSETMGVMENGAVWLQVRLTHQNLANLIGTSRETVSILMTQFAQRGLLKQARRSIQILDKEKLARVR
ncbi:MAG: Crp/Fnr family transcriptional regulator [Nitrospirales bacterium]|nr:Crp/Fnr family transcriptional regulator [Nitrospira sp.]MDR4500774.1 Crp/Fnr family transcriptional regulator [Nitrospirales bacterium]